jgi:hypothetical protein
MEDQLLEIKRAETPFSKSPKSLARGFFLTNLPIPSMLFPLLRTIYNLHIIMRSVFLGCLSIFYFEPLFRRRCLLIGKNFSLIFLPDIDSRAEITIGEGSIVGVNSVVLTDVPPYCVVMGNPAKVIARNINQSAPAKPEQA